MAALRVSRPWKRQSPEAVLPRLPPGLGGSGAGVALTPHASVEVAALADVGALLGAVPDEELEESGLAEATSDVAIVRGPDGDPGAAWGS